MNTYGQARGAAPANVYVRAHQGGETTPDPASNSYFASAYGRGISRLFYKASEKHTVFPRQIAKGFTGNVVAGSGVTLLPQRGFQGGGAPLATA
jgi:hypothetical protein